MPRKGYPRTGSAALVACAMALAALAVVAQPLEDKALTFFPGADRVGEPDGSPRAAPVFAGERLAGYVFLTDDIVKMPAYSGKPISTLVGLDTEGRIAGVQIVSHEEPILLVGISEADLAAYVAQYPGLDGTEPIKVGGEPRAGVQTIDGITGATITVMVLNATITRSAAQVAVSRALPLPRREGEPRRAVAPAPLRTLDTAPAPEPDLWRAVWAERTGRVLVLGLGLALLTTILVLQDWLTRHRTLVTYLRTAFLAYTLVFIGWYALAQLSVVNVLTFAKAMMHDFRWETFLIDPMMFILWSFVAVTVLLWGRGVYCGWLCPFGALQELVNKAALRLGVRQLELPPLVHERLLAIKYIVLLALFGISLQSMGQAVQVAEVEPFKTAINMHFQRAWPFTAWAGLLVALSVVNGKLYCKYLCPLGAALSIPAHFRIFDWLRRRKECGRPCQTCATECPSQAIRPTGEINANECHHCLDCQITYWNPRKCPPLVEKRKRMERQGRELEISVLKGR